MKYWAVSGDWSIYRNHREGYTGKVMTSSYSSNAAAPVQEETSFWESTAQGSDCVSQGTQAGTPCCTLPLEISWVCSQAERLLRKQTEKVSQLVFLGTNQKQIWRKRNRAGPQRALTSMCMKLTVVLQMCPCAEWSVRKGAYKKVRTAVSDLSIWIEWWVVK